MVSKNAIVGIIVALVYTNGGAFAATGGVTRGGSLRISNPQSSSTSAKSTVSVSSGNSATNSARVSSMYTPLGLTKLNKITPSAEAAKVALAELEGRVNDLSEVYNSLDTKYDQLSNDVSYASGAATTAKTTADNVRNQLAQKLNIGDFDTAFDRRATARQLADQPYVRQVSQDMATSETVTALTNRVSALEANPNTFTRAYIKNTANEPGYLLTYRNDEIIAKTPDKCKSLITDTETTKQLQERCTVQEIPVGATNASGAHAGDTYTIGTAQPLPNAEDITYAYIGHTLTERGRLETRRGSEVIAKSLDECATKVIGESAKKLQQICLVQPIPEGATNTGWWQPGTEYTIGGDQDLPTPDEITKTYVKSTASMWGYVTVKQGAKEIGRTDDICKPEIGPKLSTSNEGLLLKCTVQDLASDVTVPSGVVSGSQYTIESSDMPETAQYVYVYRAGVNCETSGGKITCEKPGYATRHTKNSVNTYAAYPESSAIGTNIPDSCPSQGLDKNNNSVAPGALVAVHSIQSVCTRGKADLYPNSVWENTTEYTLGTMELPAMGETVLVYRPADGCTPNATCETLGSVLTFNKIDGTQSAALYNNATPLDKKPDTCTSRGTKASQDAVTFDGIQETCRPGFANYYPTGWGETSTYKLGKIELPAMDETVLVYRPADGCTPNATCQGTGIVLTFNKIDGTQSAALYNNATPLDKKPDTCTSRGTKASQDAVTFDGIQETCRPGFANYYPTGWGETSTYKLGKIELPAMDETVLVYRPADGCTPNATCETLGSVLTFNKIDGTQSAALYNNATPLDKKTDNCTSAGTKVSQDAANFDGIQETCRPGFANYYPTGWGETSAYKLGKIELPGKDPAVKTYTYYGPTDGKPGYLRTLEDGVFANDNPDVCKSDLGKDTDNDDAMATTCIVQKLPDGTTNSSGLAQGETYQLSTPQKLPKVTTDKIKALGFQTEEDNAAKYATTTELNKKININDLATELAKTTNANAIKTAIGEDTIMRYPENTATLSEALVSVLSGAGTCSSDEVCETDIAKTLRSTLKKVGARVEEAAQ